MMHLRSSVADLALRYGLVAALVVMSGFLSLTRDTFFTSTNIQTMLLTSAASVIIAVPLAMLLQSGGIDFSIGSTLGVAVVAGGHFMSDFGWHPVVASLAVIGVCALIGAVNGFLCAKLELSPVVVTIGMLFMLRGFAFVVSGAEVRRDFGRGFRFLGQSRTVWLDIPAPVLVAAVWVTVLLTFWYRTRWGRHAHAAGANEDAAGDVGINVHRARFKMYVLVAVSAGLAGLIQLSRLDSAPPVTGNNLELEILTAVLLAGVAFSGGFGSAANAVTGVLFLTVLGNALIQFRVDTDWSRVVEGAVLVASAGFQVAIVRASTRQRGSGWDDSDPAREESALPVTIKRAARSFDELEPVLEVRGATKTFGPIVALRSVSFAVRPGEVVALLGDNGAGKSTVVKALTGLHALNAGEIRVQGRAVRFRSPLDAQAAGIEAVQQRLGVVGIYDSAQNLFLGREPVFTNPIARSAGWIDRKQMRIETAAELDKLGVKILDIGAPVASLSGGQRQSVAVARAGRWAESVVLMDEPTAALGVEQSAEVLRLITELAERGTAVLLVTHDMPQVLAVCDRAVVLRRGAVVADEAVTSNTTIQHLVGLITGAVTFQESGV